ncbi:hypothetical protein [Streptomyces sp. SID1121]|uniref:hypothetical protein n=1 Tax=Streptomyces sp. SID1121 TaxID=3425888 RepID=UPI0040572133
MTPLDAVDAVTADIRDHRITPDGTGLFNAVRHIDLLSHLVRRFADDACQHLGQTHHPSPSGHLTEGLTGAVVPLAEAVLHYTRALVPLTALNTSPTTTLAARTDALQHHSLLRTELAAAVCSLGTARAAIHAPTSAASPNQPGTLPAVAGESPAAAPELSAPITDTEKPEAQTPAKEYEKTTAGLTSRISLEEGQQIVDYHQGQGSVFVKSMTQDSNGAYHIVLKDWDIKLVPVDAKSAETQVPIARAKPRQHDARHGPARAQVSQAQEQALRSIAAGGVSLTETTRGRLYVNARDRTRITVVTYNSLVRRKLVARNTNTTLYNGQALSLTEGGRAILASLAPPANTAPTQRTSPRDSPSSPPLPPTSAGPGQAGRAR